VDEQRGIGLGKNAIAPKSQLESVLVIVQKNQREPGSIGGCVALVIEFGGNTESESVGPIQRNRADEAVSCLRGPGKGSVQ
jgi:hypothetical protein